MRRDRARPIGTFALVLRMPIDMMPELVRYAQGIEDAKVVYQVTSVGRLRIVEDTL